MGVLADGEVDVGNIVTGARITQRSQSQRKATQTFTEEGLIEDATAGAKSKGVHWNGSYLKT